MMQVEIICPLYNARNYIIDLNKSLLDQKDVKIKKISYILTESKDDTEKIMKDNNIKYEKITSKEFSHSLTREKYALRSKADILVFITQDVVIKDELWLKKLIHNIEDDKCEAAFSRQVTKFNNIEKYTRERNYPSESRIVSKKDLKDLGLRTFFFSDAASAIKATIFKDLKGYDGKNLPTNEDMYFAYKLIMSGYRISYEAESVVYHSHNFKLKELYKRYKLTGMFMKQNSYLNKYGTNESGMDLAKYVLKRAWQDKNFKVLLRWLPDMAARYIGMKIGER